MLTSTETQASETGDTSVLNWGTDAPRGGKAVLNRALKENTTVPLFFAQTMISSLRDVGYSHTTSALCEHVDNAIEAGATEVRIYFRQIGKKGDYETDIAVSDNGKGKGKALTVEYPQQLLPLSLAQCQRRTRPPCLLARLARQGSCALPVDLCPVDRQHRAGGGDADLGFQLMKGRHHGSSSVSGSVGSPSTVHSFFAHR